MSFKTICGECGAEGRLIQKKEVSVFSRTVRGEGNITIFYGEEEGYDVINIKCSKCGHEIADG